MRTSLKWIKDLVPGIEDLTPQEYLDAMTLSGSKGEYYVELDKNLENIVIGQILKIEKHPDADKLVICQVNVGQEEPVQIVTGAPNVFEGAVVPVVLAGGKVAGGHDGSTPPEEGIKIKKGKLRGVPSNGMMCSIEELGSSRDMYPDAPENGIYIFKNRDDIKPGDDAIKALGLDDAVIEYEITSNRVDCFSILGIAREAAVTFGKPFCPPVVEPTGNDEDVNDFISVEVNDTELCPRYTARVVKNIKVGPSPEWMQRRLAAQGIRPINNIVDITNYVMLEYGQPMHAFDYRYVKGGRIIVRRAEEGEELTTLDGQVRKLNANHLVIADETRAVGLAGIMGGENSEIVSDTADVVFESACFDGTCIRKGALALGMRTEASAKFEKGLDPMNTLPAVQRACELVELLGAGEVVDGVIDILNHVPQPRTIRMDPKRVNALLGTDIPAAEQYKYLERVEIHTEQHDFPDGPADVVIPSWRADVEGIADLAEEVARFYGYNNIPVTLMRGQTTLGGYSAEQKLENRLGALCRAFGYDEIITYSFISPACYDKIRWPSDYSARKSFQILNPLGEDTSIMRTTTLPSMLDILTRNYNYRNKSARLYELARVYLPGREDGLANESKVLTLGAYGEDMDFYAMKGAVEAILKDIRAVDIHFEGPTGAPSDASYHPGRCATVWSGSDCIGIFGQIHPLAAQNYGVDAELYCAELSFDELLNAKGPDPEYVPLPRFPAVTRDIAVVCGEKVTVGALEDCIRRGAKGLLKEVALFDISRGKGVDEGKKSVAFNLTLRADDRSLTSEEADADVKAVLELLEQELGAVLR